MKKIILIFAILNCFIFGADSFIKENDIFIQGGKAYLLATDKEVTGVLLKEKDGFATYSTYSKGVKTKEKVLNSKREVISEYSYDTNGLITGKVRYSDDYGVTSEAQYINGVRNGFSKANYYEDLDYEGNFSYGIAHGKIKFLDGNYVLQEKTFSNGVINNTVGKTQFSGYFIGNFVNSEKIKLEKELAYKNNKLFSGLAFKSTDGYVSSGTFYKMGVKKAYFEFDNGFMNRALIYTSPKNYTEYKYMSYNFLKGVAYTITIFVNDVENGPYTTYYEDGWRFEGTFKDGKLIGTGYYYDENNKIKEVHQYLNDTYKSTLYFDYDKKIVEGTVEGKKVNSEWVKTGKAIYYNKNGVLEEEIVYDGNKGYTKFYYENGKVKKEGYVDAFTNFYEGELKEYYETGTLKAKYNYVDGYLDGNQYYYDEKGIETKIEKYDYGYLVN